MKIVGAASECHRKQMEHLGNFCQADVVKYEDRGQGETYLITRGKDTLEIRACASRFEGGFLAVECGLDPLKVLGSESDPNIVEAPDQTTFKLTERPMTWDEYLLRIAQTVSLKSKDPSTKVGAVIVGPAHEIRTTGFNGAPMGCDECHERPKKLLVTEHAERNAIFLASRFGTPLLGCTLYMNVDVPPCAECARAIINAGIVRVVGVSGRKWGKGDWEESRETAIELLEKAEIPMDSIEVEL